MSKQEENELPNFEIDLELEQYKITTTEQTKEFIKEHIQTKANRNWNIPKEQFHTKYNEWRQKKGLLPVNKNILSEIMSHRLNMPQTRLDKRGYKYKVWKYINWNNEQWNKEAKIHTELKMAKFLKLIQGEEPKKQK